MKWPRFDRETVEDFLVTRFATQDGDDNRSVVLFCATKRVGGGVLDFNALRLLTFSL